MDEMNNDAVHEQATTAPQTPLSEEDRLLLEEADAQFIGTYSHSVDAKGRLVVPQSFRQMLGQKFYIAPSRDFKAVALYSKLAWARTRHRYAKLDPVNNDVLLLLEQFNALSYRDQECDGQGRVLLPPRIRQLLLGDEKELEISGAGDHVRIVGTAAYMNQFQQVLQHMPDIMKTINLLQAREMRLEGAVLAGERSE